jgi:hypothetical protein
MAADPRFAAWAASALTEDQAQQAHVAKMARIRVAALKTINAAESGEKVAEGHLQWAIDFLRANPA